MKTRIQTRHVLFAATLLVASAGASALTGYSVTSRQEEMVKPGMTFAEVQQALGKPSIHIKFPNESGVTWTYKVIDAAKENAVFDVDFAADGMVASVIERTVPAGHGMAE